MYLKFNSNKPALGIIKLLLYYDIWYYIIIIVRFYWKAIVLELYYTMYFLFILLPLPFFVFDAVTIFYHKYLKSGCQDYKSMEIQYISKTLGL